MLTLEGKQTSYNFMQQEGIADSYLLLIYNFIEARMPKTIGAIVGDRNVKSAAIRCCLLGGVEEHIKQFLELGGFVRFKNGESDYQAFLANKNDEQKAEKERMNALITYQILTASQQAEIHPLIEIANREAILTNGNTRRSNHALIIIFSFTLVFTVVSSITAILTYKNEVRKTNEAQQLKNQLTQISHKDTLLGCQSQIIAGQKYLIDSLKVRLDSLTVQNTFKK